MFSLSDLKRTRYYQEVREEVREELQQEVREELQQEVRQQEALELIRRLLLRRIGAVNPQLQERIEQLSVDQLEDLAEALLDFSNEANLAAWLHENSNQSDEE
jgi:predicted transposase YdaD